VGTVNSTKKFAIALANRTNDELCREAACDAAAFGTIAACQVGRPGHLAPCAASEFFIGRKFRQHACLGSKIQRETVGQFNGMLLALERDTGGG